MYWCNAAILKPNKPSSAVAKSIKGKIICGSILISSFLVDGKGEFSPSHHCFMI